MARYLDVAAEIARQVREGRFRPGDELPAVRDCAHAQATTATTVGRAYRHLADSGVISVADRRRARVHTDGVLAAARLLEADRVFRLAGSDDPALQIVLDHVGPAVATVGTRGSFQGLRALSRGDADGAAIHLRHHTGVYNAPFAAALLRHRGPTLLRLWRREQGLIVPPGNPLDLTGPADLTAVRVAKREHGAGTRVLLEQLLHAASVDSTAVAGPELHSHLEVGLAVAAGIADAAVGLRTDANELGLDFVPLTWEFFDIVLPADALGAAQPLAAALAEAKVRDAVLALGGYDLACTGRVESL